MKGDKRRQQQQAQVTVSTQTQSQQQLGVSGTPLAEENKVLAGACHKLVNQMDEMERELIAARRQVEVITPAGCRCNGSGGRVLAAGGQQCVAQVEEWSGWRESWTVLSRTWMNALEQQERELTEQHNAASWQMRVWHARTCSCRMSELEDQVTVTSEAAAQGKWWSGAAGEYTEGDYLALEGERTGWHSRVDILTQRSGRVQC